MKNISFRIFLSFFVLLIVGIFFIGVVNANPYCATPAVSCTNNYTCPAVTGLQKTDCCFNAANNCICKISWASGTCGAAVNGQYYGSTGGSSATVHCLRPDISRWKAISPTVSFSPTDEIVSNADGSFIVPIDATLRLSGFGSFNYFCDNGWSPLVVNYVDVYDNINHKIIATNGINQTSGPQPAGSTICTRRIDGMDKICYVDGCGPDNNPCSADNSNFNYMVGDKGQCSASSFKMGAGKNLPIILPLSAYIGEQDWSLRLGAISPANVSPDSPYIMPIELKRIKFSVVSSSMLVFAPKPLERLNSYENSGVFEKEIYFTLLNKSKIKNKINDYNIVCPADVTCTFEKYDGQNMYEDFIIEPNSAIVIPLTVSFNKNNIPRKFSLYLDVSYAPLGINTCDGVCTTVSSPVTFESGLLDKQDFQINVTNQQEQKYCVDLEGNIGQTGEVYAPKVNLYFGGNVTPQLNTDSQLVSMNECSSQDYNDLSVNSNWVYCSSKEFLVQLSARLGKFGENSSSIISLEQLGEFSAATKLREENGRLLGFNANLREVNISSASIINTADSLKDIQGTFTKIGFAGEVDNIDKLNTLLKGINFVQTINGVEVENSVLSPGEYKVTVDVNAITQVTSGSYLFSLPTVALNEGLNIKVKLEKINSPMFDWFFYYNQNDSFAEEFANPSSVTSYTTNVLNRGAILEFEKIDDSFSAKNFYPTYSVPLVTRIKDKNIAELSDSKFEVSGYDKDIFTYWTAFASSKGEGCETTSESPPEGVKVLPYRVNDSNLSSGEYEISELSSVLADSVMYLGTVLYLPTNDLVAINTILLMPFRSFTKKGVFDGNASAYSMININPSDPVYSQYKIESLENALNGISNETVCVLYDNSTGTEKWKLFWNQDKMLDSLLSDINSQISDAKICESRMVMSS